MKNSTCSFVSMNYMELDIPMPKERDLIHLSVVVPCFNEEGTLHELYSQVRVQFDQLNITGEIIYIDDGSTDTSRNIIRQLASTDPNCRLIAFRCNSGKAAALQLGFRAARGEYIITMDADLQDDPQEIPRFLQALTTADVVSGWKANRHDPVGKTLPSLLFNTVVRNTTGVQLHDMNCGFKGYRRQVLQEINLYGEMHRYIPALAAARGFTIAELIVTHHARRSGVSKYGWERFTRGFLDLMTVVYLTRYRFRPLHLFGGIGIAAILIGLLFATSLSTYRTLAHDDLSLFLNFITIALLVCGPLLFACGLLAENMLHNGFSQLPPPPIAEVINFSADEVKNAE